MVGNKKVKDQGGGWSSLMSVCYEVEMQWDRSGRLRLTAVVCCFLV